MKSFAIEQIIIRKGHYIFHNENVQKDIDEVSEQQIIDYILKLDEQKKQAQAALICKAQRKKT